MPIAKCHLLSLPAALLAATLLLPVSVAADFQSGVDAYNRGDYASAFSLFQILAQQGNIDAQNNLGVLYQTGRGTAKDPAAAARWYRAAAERGHTDAQSNLAALYVQGEGVSQDLVLAYAWFNRAAGRGDENARKNLAALAQQMSPDQIARAERQELFAPTVPTPNRATASAAQSPRPATDPTPPSSAPQPQERAAAPPAAVPVTLEAAPVAPSADYYGPVARGETLWSIAKRLRPDPTLTTQQVVLALQRANPDAFSDGTISTLRAGARLRIPSLAEMRQTDAASARAEVDRQLGR